MRHVIIIFTLFVGLMSNAQESPEFCVIVEEGVEYTWDGDVATMGDTSYTYVDGDSSIAILNERFVCSYGQSVVVNNLPDGAVVRDMLFEPLYNSNNRLRSSQYVDKNYTIFRVGAFYYIDFASDEVDAIGNTINLTSVSRTRRANAFNVGTDEYGSFRIDVGQDVDLSVYRVSYSLSLSNGSTSYHVALVNPTDGDYVLTHN